MGAVLVPLFIAAAYAVFVLDTGVWCKADTPEAGVCTWGYWIARLQWWPFGRTQGLGWFPSWLVRDLGFRVVHPSFWIAAVWAGTVVVGAALVARTAGPERRRRLLPAAAFTVIGVVVLPEVVGPLLIERPERLRALATPWPLGPNGVVHGPTGGVGAALGWVGLGVAAFAAVLLDTARRGRRFCASLCPYGALSSTLGRWFEGVTPRGSLARRLEGAGKAVLAAAVGVAALRLSAEWGWGPSDLARRVDHGYRVAVLLGGMGVLGFGLAPLLGPRAWCRWLCPLGAAMDRVARASGRAEVQGDVSGCSGCSGCTSACTMGVPVAAALENGPITASDGQCIGCGLCVDACPEDRLELVAIGAPR